MKKRVVLRSTALALVALFCMGKVQAASISGKIVDARTGEPMMAASIIVTSVKDSTQRRYVTTGNDGSFVMRNLAPQNYRVVFAFLGYEKITQQLNLKNDDKDFGRIRLKQDALEMEEVKVAATAVRAAQRGDTVEFNADAYKVTQDANAEDLIKKLPGITVENGTVKTQGEDVKKVLVDGKPFFGDDPTIAIRNLPAEVIAKIEVFDKQSEQAQLTGFDDGNSEKTINIVTRENRRMGQFGRIYGGGGYDDVQEKARYNAGGNISLFNKNRRVSIVGMTNNVNQRDFASEDLVSSGGGGRRGGSSFGGGGGDGVATTTALGINYSDMWGKKMEVTGSYFFNVTDNDAWKKLNRQYFVAKDSVQLYDQLSTTTTKNYNHRLNLRMDYKFNEKTSLLYIPRLSFQTRDNDNRQVSEMVGLNWATSDNNTQSHAFNFDNELLLRHKFNKQGRTISANVRFNISDSQSDNKLLSQTMEGSVQKSYRNQQSSNPTNNWSARSNIAYTEPVGKVGIIQANYEVNFSHGESNKKTYNIDSVTHENLGLDSLYSNIYNNDYLTHRTGLSYRIRSEKLNGMIGVNAQYATLDGQQTMPIRPAIDKSYTSFLPMAMFEYKFTKQQAFRAFYRASTNAPSISQLQSVIDNSNPLLLRTGNPDLNQTYSQSLSLRYNQTSLEKAVTFFAMFFASNTMDNITTSTITARQDTVIRIHSDTVVLLRGSQFSRPVNLSGYWNARGVVTFGLPIGFIKSNLNLTTTASYSRQPGYVNGAKNTSDNYGIGEGVVLSSNISQYVDFTLSYNASYNITQNTLQTRDNENYFKHSANGRLNLVVWKGITFQGVAHYDQYKGLSEGYNQEYLRLDASLGKKFLKNNRGELKFTVYDILNQNKSYNRNVTESYIEDAVSNVLSRYYMLTFTYTLRNFGQAPQRNSDNPDGERPRYREGGGGGRGGGYGGYGPPM